MGILHRKSKWERMSEPVTRAVPAAARAVAPAAKSALSGVGVLVGVSAASAALSALRQRKSSQ
jgi:hypothetical protein